MARKDEPDKLFEPFCFIQCRQLQQNIDFNVCHVDGKCGKEKNVEAHGMITWLHDYTRSPAPVFVRDSVRELMSENVTAN